MSNCLLRVLFIFLSAFSCLVSKAQVDYELRIRQSIIADSLILDVYVMNSGDSFAFASGDFPVIIKNEDQAKLSLVDAVLRDYSGVWSDKLNPSQFDPVNLVSFTDSIFNLQIVRAVTFDETLDRTAFTMNTGDSSFIGSIGIPILACKSNLETSIDSGFGTRTRWSNPIVNLDYPVGDIITDQANYISPGIIELNRLPQSNLYTTDSTFCGAGEFFDMVLEGVLPNPDLSWDFIHYDLSTNSYAVIHSGNGSNLSDTLTTFTNTSFENGDSLFSVLTDGFCVDSSGMVPLLMNTLDVSINSLNDTLCFGEDQLLESQVSGGVLLTNTDFTYTWSQLSGGGSTITPLNLDTAIISPSISYNIGANTYRLKVSDDIGCESSDTVDVFVNLGLVSVIPDDTTYLCTTGGLVLTNVFGSGSGGTALNASPFYKYSWTSVDETLQLVATGNPTVTIVGLSISPPYTATALVLSITDSLGCQSFDTTAVFVDNLDYEPTVDFDTICEGMTINLDTLGTDYGSGAYRFAWLGEGIPENADTLAATTAQPTKTNSYYTLVVLDNVTGCASFDSLLVTVKPIFADIYADKINVCDGETVTLNGTNSFGALEFKQGDPHKYVWTSSSIVGPSDEDTVRLSGGVPGSVEKVYLDIFDTLMCTARDSIELTWSTPVVSNIIADTIYVCNGTIQQAFSQIPVGGSGTGYSFNWRVLSGMVEFVNNVRNSKDVAFQYALANVSDTSVVQQTVTDGLGCSNSDIVVVIGIDFQIQASVAYATTCSGAVNPLDVQFINGFNGPFSYSWSPISGVDDATIKSPNAISNTSETYSVTVLDNKTSCSASSSVSVTVIETNAIINSTTDPDTIAICANDSLALDATLSFGGTPFSGVNPYSYKWVKLNGGGTSFLVSDTNKVQYVKALGAEGSYTQYELQVIDSIGCDDRDTVTIYWNEALVVNTLVDTLFICTPNSGTLKIGSITGGSIPYMSVWSLSSSAPTSMSLNDSILTATDNDESDVYLRVTDRYGCAEADTLRAIGLDFQIEAVAQYDSICLGFIDTLSVNLLNDLYGGFTYQWSPILGLSDPSVAVTQASPTVNTRYFIEVVDLKTQCRAIDRVDIGLREVTAIAGPTVNRDTLHVCSDDYSSVTSFDASLSFGGDRNNVAPFYDIYSWTSTDPDIMISSPNTEGSSVVRNTNSSGYSEIYLQITDKIGCTDRDTLVIHWNDSLILDVPITTLPNPEVALPLCVGIDTLNVAVSGGSTPYIYSWTQSNITGGQVSSIGSTDESLLLINVNSFDLNEFFKVDVTDVYGCSEFAEIFVESYDLDIEIDAGFDTICSGSQVPVRGSLITPPDTVGNVLWSWDLGLSTTDLTSQTYMPSNDTTILAIARDVLTGCMDTSSVFVKVVDLNVITSVIPTSRTICFEDTAVLEVISVIGGVSPYSYSWTDGVIIYPTDSIYVQPNVGATVYDLTVSDNNSCDTTLSITINRNAEIIVNAGRDTSLCVNAAVTLPNNGSISGSGGSGNLGYTWSSSPTLIQSATDLDEITVTQTPGLGGSHSVYLSVQDLNNPSCIITDTVEVNFVELPTAALPSTFFCKNDQVVLDPGGRPYPTGTTFEWRISPSNTIIGILDSLEVSVQGEYNLTITGPLPERCVNRDTVVVEQIELPTISIDPVNLTACNNVPVALKANVFPNEGTITWDVIPPFGNQDNFEDTSKIQTTYIPTDIDDSIRVVASYFNVCATALDTISFSFIPAPKIELETTDLEISINQSVTFEDGGSFIPLGSSLNYAWEFEGGDLFTESGPGPYTVVYPDIGTWLTSYTIQDQNTFCEDSIAVLVNVKFITTVFIPTIFSPLAKNVENQTLKVFGLNISPDDFEFIIYNRWGKIVYETTDFNEANTTGWTGNHYSSGLVQTPGVYLYTVKGKYTDGKEISETGTTTLVR